MLENFFVWVGNFGKLNQTLFKSDWCTSNSKDTFFSNLSTIEMKVIYVKGNFKKIGHVFTKNSCFLFMYSFDGANVNIFNHFCIMLFFLQQWLVHFTKKLLMNSQFTCGEWIWWWILYKMNELMNYESGWRIDDNEKKRELGAK